MSKRASAADKMSWTRTIILIGVAILLMWCVGIALSSHSTAKENAPTATFSLAEADLLHPATKPGTHERIKEYHGFTVSFNPQLHIPNWVSWELTADETTGKETRKQSFQPDKEMDGCAIDRDYRGSGYDRGHMAPAADMKWDSLSMADCFLLTNICPQLHTLNGGAWQHLEDKCRKWVQRDSALVIICGPVLSPAPDEFIGRTEVAVPKSFFKIVMAPYADPPRAIGFIMSNGYVKGGVQAAAVTIDSIESLTGHDFFPTLPDSLQQLIESQNRFYKWEH